MPEQSEIATESTIEQKNRNRQHIHKVKVKVKENHTAADNFELQAAIAEIFRKHLEFIKEVFIIYIR